MSQLRKVVFYSRMHHWDGPDQEVICLLNNSDEPIYDVKLGWRVERGLVVIGSQLDIVLHAATTEGVLPVGAKRPFATFRDNSGRRWRRRLYGKFDELTLLDRLEVWASIKASERRSQRLAETGDVGDRTRS